MNLKSCIASGFCVLLFSLSTHQAEATTESDIPGKKVITHNGSGGISIKCEGDEGVCITLAWSDNDDKNVFQSGGAVRSHLWIPAEGRGWLNTVSVISGVDEYTATHDSYTVPIFDYNDFSNASAPGTPSGN